MAVRVMLLLLAAASSQVMAEACGRALVDPLVRLDWSAPPSATTGVVANMTGAGWPAGCQFVTDDRGFELGWSQNRIVVEARGAFTGSCSPPPYSTPLPPGAPRVCVIGEQNNAPNHIGFSGYTAQPHPLGVHITGIGVDAMRIPNTAVPLRFQFRLDPIGSGVPIVSQSFQFAYPVPNQTVFSVSPGHYRVQVQVADGTNATVDFPTNITVQVP